MKTNYKTPFAELGYSEDYQRFLFKHLGLLANMEEDFKDYEEQGFSHIEAYAVYKLSQMSINDLINHVLDLVAVLEYEIEKTQEVIGNIYEHPELIKESKHE